MSRPRKRKNRSDEETDVQDASETPDVSAELQGDPVEAPVEPAHEGVEASPDNRELEAELVRAVDEVADAIVAAVIDQIPVDDEPGPFAATDEEEDGALLGEDSELGPGLEKAPPLPVGTDHLKSVIESLLF